MFAKNAASCPPEYTNGQMFRSLQHDGGAPEDDAQISYRAWGEQFFRTAISEERILGAVDDLAGQPIDFGPMGVGPGWLAKKIRAYGEIGRAMANRLAGEDEQVPISYRVLLPVSLSFEVDLQVETHRFQADLLVPLTLTARALDAVRICVDVVPPAAGDVQVNLRAEGLRASIVKRLVNVEAELGASSRAPSRTSWPSRTSSRSG